MSPATKVSSRTWWSIPRIGTRTRCSPFRAATGTGTASPVFAVLDVPHRLVLQVEDVGAEGRIGDLEDEVTALPADAEVGLLIGTQWAGDPVDAEDVACDDLGLVR